MDFQLNPAEQGVESLCAKILGDLVTEVSLREIETADRWVHTRAWKALADAGVLGVALPEEYGGSDTGLLALCLLLRQLGRATAPSPALSTLVMGALPVAHYGTAEQKAHWLPLAASGEACLTAALPAHGTGSAIQPTVRATVDGTGYRLAGECSLVPGLPEAQRVIVPTEASDGRVLLLLVAPQSAGVTLHRSVTSSGEPLHDMVFSNVRVESTDLLGTAETGRAIAARLYQWTTLGVCALTLGVAERALRMTARYASERHQFGKPIGSFQAVSQRAADAYIDVAAMKVTLWQAAYRLGANLPCERELAIAKFYAAEGGHRVVAASQHIHAGMGFDRDYPLHRSFLWAKRLEFTLGGASAQLATLGSLLAGERA